MALIAIPAAAALALLAQAMWMEQVIGPRLISLAAVVAAGALLAALAPAALLTLVGRSWPRVPRAALGALTTAAAFVPATMFAFAVEIRIIEGRVEAGSVFDLSAIELFWSLFGGMGLFTPTGLAYLLPGPLLAVSLAAFFCFHRWPSAWSPA